MAGLKRSPRRRRRPSTPTTTCRRRAEADRLMAAPHLKVVTSAADTKRSVIEIAGVSKTYRTRDGEVPSLRPLDFSVDPAECLIVVAPAGCGKSTLLKMIAGLLPPSAGEKLA